MRRKKIIHKYQVKIYKNGKFVEDVRRSLAAQRHTSYYWIPGSKDANGNRPLIVRYHGRWYPAHSRAGDLSDPEERNDSYLKSLFIDIGERRTK